jgi:hypothetical protein
MTIASRRHIRALERVRQRLSHARAAEGARRVKPGYLFILDVKDGGACCADRTHECWCCCLLPRCRCDRSCMFIDAVGSPLHCRRGQLPWRMEVVGHRRKVRLQCVTGSRSRDLWPRPVTVCSPLASPLLTQRHDGSSLASAPLLTQRHDRSLLRAFAELYPNLVGSTVVINAPTVADWCQTWIEPHQTWSTSMPTSLVPYHCLAGASAW